MAIGTPPLKAGHQLFGAYVRFTKIGLFRRGWQTGSQLCRPLLQCQRVTRLQLIGPSDCFRWAPATQAYYMDLCSEPELEDLSIYFMLGFPIHLLQRSSALRMLSLNGIGVDCIRCLPESGTPVIEGKKTVHLRKIKLGVQTIALPPFLRWLLSPTCFLDLGSLHALAVPGSLGPQFPPEVKELLMAVIRLCSQSLVSLSLGIIEGRHEISDFRETRSNDAPPSGFLSLNFDRLTNLQHLQFHLPHLRQEPGHRPRAQYSLIPSIVEWIKLHTPGVTSVTVRCSDYFPAGGASLPTSRSPSEHWISMDNAFRPSASGLEALQKVRLEIRWHSSHHRVFDDQVLEAIPSLSVLEVSRVSTLH